MSETDTGDTLSTADYASTANSSDDVPEPRLPANSNTITILVDYNNTQTPFLVDEKLISRYLRQMQTLVEENGKWQCFVVTDVEPSTFGHFLYWLQHGDDKWLPHSNISTLALVELWRLADEYLVPRLKNTAMKMLYNRAHQVREADLLQLGGLVYSTLKPSSPLRKFIYRLFVMGNIRKLIIDHSESLCKELLVDYVAQEHNHAEWKALTLGTFLVWESFLRAEDSDK